MGVNKQKSQVDGCILNQGGQPKTLFFGIEGVDTMDSILTEWI